MGGHYNGIADAPFVALKEAYEERGLARGSHALAWVLHEKRALLLSAGA
ncbi:hypothetical protein [Leisingera methylohalidivorans]|uniref:Uncharacterized protein n=1 Tax=Leisingera methylohalidivorans DSM 14336 TaxID=999552 RepID=V9VW63_9RHOB|nr:hypothetical protein [Leisingera methylohalidivorans]AHD02996.1 hypothetical protein METH_08050 [Leisingera methylohalidivorans DSM 14336]